MASITVEIVSKTTSEAGTTFVLAASEEEIKRAGFVPYFVDQHFRGAIHVVEDGNLAAVTPYGSIAMAPQVTALEVYILPFVPALTEVDVNMEWFTKNVWAPYKLEKAEGDLKATYKPNPVTPNMGVGDTLVFYDKKPADPA